MKIINRIHKANADRDPERLAMKYAAMRTDPFIFLRGTCHLFYDRLPKSGIFKSAPVVWCCGDLHLENFGSYKGDNRLAYFDLNDFDEAAKAPVTWDLSRLMVSILVAAPGLGLSHDDALALAEHFLHAYSDALNLGKARWVERETSSGLVGDLLHQLQHRSRVAFLNRRTQKKDGGRRFRIDGKKFLAVTEAQRHKVLQFMETFRASHRHPQLHADFFRVVDIARRVAGTGSLGVERYAILVQGKGSPDQNYLLDLKQALPSSIADHLPALQPAWSHQAERVVAIQRRMQAVSMAFLQAVKIGKQSYVLRALQPSEDRVPLAGQQRHRDHLYGVLEVMGQCLAWAQLRSSGRQGSAISDELIDFSARQKWRGKLLAACEELASQVHEDWKTYVSAYDDGVFRLP